MIEITFTGETLQDVAEQAAQFAATVNGEPKVKAAGKKTTKAATPPSEPATSAAPVEPPQEPAPEKVDTKKLEETKEEALDVLRKVYGLGENGVLQVRNILRHYKVKKAGDVPVENAAELLTKANEALKLVVAAKDEEEDAPI